MKKQIKAENNSGVEIEYYGESQEQKLHQIGSKEIDELYASYNCMKNFSSQVPQLIDFDPSQILSKYAERAIKVELIAKNVMQFLDKRIQRMLKNKKLKKNWSGQDIQILYWTFSYYCRVKQINSVQKANLADWKNIARLIPGSSPDGCMFKILSLKKTKLGIQKWTQQQSQLLSEIVSKHEGEKNWRIISQQLFKHFMNEDKIFRNAKQCKQHWVSYLNPLVRKGSWTANQDIKLLQFVYQRNGSRRWAQMARVFGGRTQNALKNRYPLIIQRLRKQKNCQDSNKDMELVKSYLNRNIKNQELQINNLVNQSIRKTYSSDQQIKQFASVKKVEATAQKYGIIQQREETYCNNHIYSVFPLTADLRFNSTFLQMTNQTLPPISFPPVKNFHNPAPLYFIYSPLGSLTPN